VSPVFKLKDLVKLYSRLHSLGITDEVNVTYLKEKICANVASLESFKQGRNVLLAFKNDVGQALADACKNRSDEYAMCLARAAGFVRKELFLQKGDFSGSFDDGCEQRSVPDILVTLIQMILEGPSIKKQVTSTNVSLTIAQLINYITVSFTHVEQLQKGQDIDAAWRLHFPSMWE